MTRRNNNSRNMNNRQRQPRYRRNAKRRNNYSRSALPPAKTLMGHVMRTVVQTLWDITQGALSSTPISKTSANPTNVTQDIDDGWILAQYWINRFKGLFKEIKLHSLVAHFVPYETITAPGEYIFTLCDYGENSTPSSVANAVGMPASVIRKNGSPAKLVWYPTEPEDRNWHVIGDQHKYCSFTLREMEDSYNTDDNPPGNRPRTVGIQGKVVIEANASFRGKPDSPTVQHPLRDSPAGSAEYKQYQQTITCTCRKCIRPFLRDFVNSIRPSMSGTSSPFSVVGEMGRVTLDA